MLTIAASAQVSELADIQDSVRGSRIDIGERVFIDSFVRIRPVGGRGDIAIGDDSYINSGTVIFSGNGVQIGRSVLIAPNWTLAPTNHAFGNCDVEIRLQGFMPSKGGIVIEDDVWIGAGVIILDGAILRRGCVVGAGSLVKGEVEAFSINVGNPLRKVGMRGG